MDKLMADRMGLADVDWGTGAGAVLMGGLGLLLVLQVLLEVTQTIRYRHIPGPGGRLPVLGHALDLMKGNMWETLGKWGDQYGSVYKIFIMGKVVIIVTDTADIKHMMQVKSRLRTGVPFSPGSDAPRSSLSMPPLLTTQSPFSRVGTCSVHVHTQLTLRLSRKTKWLQPGADFAGNEA